MWEIANWNLLQVAESRIFNWWDLQLRFLGLDFCSFNRSEFTAQMMLNPLPVIPVVSRIGTKIARKKIMQSPLD